ncbi:putative ribonuclease H-like domain-containing protein [Tanacetum coccineum]|uniref:Ribonuclease H-like domain-containing protein n=1 Tax=Tanacetum coccineum TaxID=301880 RepID=A0ABQ4YQW6_9ASTR
MQNIQIQCIFGLITPVKQKEKRAVHIVSIARPVSTARPVYNARPVSLVVRPKGLYSPIKRSYYTKLAFRPKDLKQDVKTFRVQNMTTAGTRAVVNTGKEQNNREFSVGYKLSVDGVAERKNRTLIEADRTMLADSLSPISFLAEAVNTACYVLNRVLVTKPQNKTPYELLIGTHRISFMKTFWDALDILNNLDSLGKFDGNAGYSTTNVVVDNFKRCCTSYTFDVGYKFQVWYIKFTSPSDHDNSRQNTRTRKEKEIQAGNTIQDQENSQDNLLLWKALEDFTLKTNEHNTQKPNTVYESDLTEYKDYHFEDWNSDDDDDVSEVQSVSLHHPEIHDHMEDSVALAMTGNKAYLHTDYKDSIELCGFGSDPKEDKYVADILKKFDFWSIRTATTPIESNKPLVKDEDGEDIDVHVYRSMIGSLMYLTALRPDIMFVVCACARFQVTPKASHLNAVKRIFRYLKHQPKLGLWYPRDSPFELEAFSDSDYGGASLDRKSTTGGCQFLGRRLISWQCKKQTIVANSTTEAEYVAAANCCGQVLWIQNQMMDYGFNFMNTRIHIDNESTISVIKNPVAHSRTKHIEIRFHFIRDCYEKRLIEVIKIHTDSNVADLLTKGFDVTRFNFLVVSIGMLNL